MPFSCHYLNVCVLPHVFSRFDAQSKAKYRKRYVNMKRGAAAGTMGIMGASEGASLAKDLISSKLKAYGYKSLFALTLGPAVQFIALPLYMFSYGSKVRRIAIACSELGAQITKGEVGIINWAWVAADFVLFGEPVSITENVTFMILSNETAGHISNIVEEVYSNGN